MSKKDSNGNDVMKALLLKEKIILLMNQNKVNTFLIMNYLKKVRENIGKDTTSFLGGQIREITW